MAKLEIEFKTDYAAEFALTNSGFSVGRQQADGQSGILFGDYDIHKWRNMSASEKNVLHGTFKRRGPPGSPTTVVFRSDRATGQALRQMEFFATAYSTAAAKT